MHTALHRLITAKGSYSKAGKAIGVSQQAITQYVQGKCVPSLVKGDALARYLEISTEELVKMITNSMPD